MSDKHPAPWKWDASSSSPRDPRVADFLRDGRGNIILSADVDEDISIASPVVRELIRLAPEMEALLRKAEWTAWQYGFCISCYYGEVLEDGTKIHKPGCPYAAVLAALDAARNGT